MVGADIGATPIRDGSTATEQRLVLYRGTLDLKTMELYEGQLCSTDGNLSGRIVRLSLHKAMKFKSKSDSLADWGTSDIEMMVTNSNGNTDAFIVKLDPDGDLS